MTRAAVVAAVVLTACSRSAPIDSCDDPLRGVWRGERGAWMILDSGETLEAYPLFADAPAPRVIDLVREGNTLSGQLRRRYMQAGTSCTATLPVKVTACSSEALDIVLADPSPPIAFEPCTWPRANPSRRERWLRD